MHVSLTAKFVIGSFVVAGATSLMPDLAQRLGIAFSTWGTLFVALGVGGIIGFFLSRMFGVKFEALRQATDRIREGDLRLELASRRPSRLPDEMDDLYRGLADMLVRLRQLVASVQQTSRSVAASSTGLEAVLGDLRRTSEGVSSTVAQVASGVAQEQDLLGQASHRMAEISSEIDLNAGRAREAFGFAAEANQKAGTGVEVARLAIEKMKVVFERAESTGVKVFQLEAQDAPRPPDHRDHHLRRPPHESALAQRLDRGRARGRGGPRLLGRRRRDPQALRERGQERRRDQPS